MKRISFGAIAFVLSTAILAPSPASAQAPEKAPKERREHSPLEKEMESINRGMRKLSRQAADPAQKEDSLKLVAEIQKSAAAAKALTPPKATKLAEPEKAKYLETYQKDMDALGGQLDDLKKAIEIGTADEIKAAMDKLNTLKRTSHKELGVGNEKRPRKGPGAEQPEQPASPQ